ncbi:glycosyltransferase [Nonlabens marinus]|uniref:Glycosyltransferase n=1 Tax=Nonlabens marinus S1-08 TaxID=1454201 RepID=W8VSB6_9FLAO|nr:glycosyltransferase family 2 protein [Nonlabens marinus]BAO56784.1 glycosyltransferase [Nonlabens marinus S1-08]
MHIAIVIPAFNEEALIAQTLESLCDQTHPAAQIVVVDDNSTDHTYDIAASFITRLPLQVIRNSSSAENIPGAKVIQAFKKGLSLLDLSKYDVICKFDADLIFPTDYLEQIVVRFRESDTIGMVAGHCTIEKNGSWVLENQNNPDHIRGALKAYRINCFDAIGGLKTSIGWDTMDEMLARYNGWKVVTIEGLHVKHLKPTGVSYKPKSLRLQGEAFYKMRYGLPLTMITAIKMAFKNNNWRLIGDYLQGYFNAQKSDLDPLMTKDQGRFLRSYRWKGIKSKIGF